MPISYSLSQMQSAKAIMSWGVVEELTNNIDRMAGNYLHLVHTALPQL